MNEPENTIHGKKISMREALKGLGDPETWKDFADKQYAEFRAKPNLVTDELNKLAEEYRINTENLTRAQFVEALIQAIACGDFQRNVIVSAEIPNIKQQVTYIPFREVERLQSRIRILEETLDQGWPDWRDNDRNL